MTELIAKATESSFRRLVLAAGAALILALSIHNLSTSEPENAPRAVQSALPAFEVGDSLSSDAVHLIEDAGHYGLGAAPEGSRYAVAGGKLVRVDGGSLMVRSILREQQRILD